METTDYHLKRKNMVERQIMARGIRDPRVLDAMRKVPRHLFVEEAFAARAYGDFPLPIGENQTISQPYIVAQMTEALAPKSDDIVLEIGTGSGYQTAILAELCYRVYTVERIRSLSIRARKILESIGYYNIMFKVGDGTLGWKEHGPFDAIIVTAGAPEIPQPLLEHLAPKGRMVVPVGKDRFSQNLLKVSKDETGRITTEDLGGCRFVDLVGQYGW